MPSINQSFRTYLSLAFQETRLRSSLSKSLWRTGAYAVGFPRQTSISDSRSTFDLVDDALKAGHKNARALRCSVRQIGDEIAAVGAPRLDCAQAAFLPPVGVE